jgi:hypothetical protein
MCCFSIISTHQARIQAGTHLARAPAKKKKKKKDWRDWTDNRLMLNT